MRRIPFATSLLLAFAVAHDAFAARAWLQPDRIALGQTTTLNVEVDGAFADAPDFSVLERSFELRGQSSSTQTTIRNGDVQTRTLYAIVLEPREAGVIGIPEIHAGAERTQALSLTVLPPATGSAANNDPIFLESRIEASDPYVQQPVPYTVRLYYAIPLLDGQVDARAPDGASLQKVGEDRQYQQDLNGRRYHVFERTYLLIPERSGPLELPAPQFRGRAMNDDMDAFFSRGGRGLSLVGERTTLDVRAQPADAPQPWLPVVRLTLARTAPENVRAGEPAMLELRLVADGALSSQLPELELPPIAGAQVFPEPAKRSDVLSDGRPQATLLRRFALVANSPGRIEIPAMRVPYWNRVNHAADAATLDALVLDVAAGTTAATPAAATGAPAVAADAAVASASARPWQWLSAALAVALVLALGWGWRRGRVSAIAPEAIAAPARTPPSLARALASGDLRIVANTLRALSEPESASLEVLAARLADPAQRDAIDALERALWAANDDRSVRDDALARLRSAFRNGPAFARAPSEAAPVLPPLYPRRKAG